MKFNFTGVDAVNKTGLYDFSKGAQLVTLVFTLRANSTGDANVMLNVTDLGTFDKDYVENGTVKDNSATVNATINDEEATTSATEETEVTIATGDTGSTTPTSSETTGTETTEPTDTQTTNPTESSENTIPTQTTETTKPTEPTKPTQPTTKPQSVNDADKTISKTDTDNGDPKGSTFAPITLKATSSSKKAVKLSWAKVKGAKGYYIYGAKCGNSLKKIKTVSSGTTKLTVKKLKKGTYYKYLVMAYKTQSGKKVTASMSKVVHVTTTGKAYGNPSKVIYKKTSVSVKRGQSMTLKPTVKVTKKIKKHVALRFESTNTKVVTVNSKGKITGKSKGSATIYGRSRGY